MTADGCVEKIPELVELQEELAALHRREHILRRLIEIVERRDKWAAEDRRPRPAENGGGR